MDDRQHLHALFQVRARAREQQSEMHADFMRLCEIFDTVAKQRDEAHVALGACVTAINQCMLEMSRNGDSITVRGLADAARAKASALLETSEVA